MAPHTSECIVFFQPLKHYGKYLCFVVVITCVWCGWLPLYDFRSHSRNLCNTGSGATKGLVCARFIGVVVVSSTYLSLISIDKITKSVENSIGYLPLRYKGTFSGFRLFCSERYKERNSNSETDFCPNLHACFRLVVCRTAPELWVYLSL